MHLQKFSYTEHRKDYNAETSLGKGGGGGAVVCALSQGIISIEACRTKFNAFRMPKRMFEIKKRK